MELFQELVFTISFSLIVSLLIAKLFSVASSCDESSSIMVEEKEWVVCDSEKHDDQLKVNENIVFGSYDDGDLGSGVVIDDLKNVGGVDACQLFDETCQRNEFKDDDVGVGVGVDLVKSDEEGSLIQQECVTDVEIEQELSTDEAKFDDDDDWQGIETTDLEKTFGAAVAFMGSKSSVDRVNSIGNDVKIQLYGLHRVANEGSCFEPQPMALKVSARANWNAWKRLENLGRDDAMEQYIDLLSRHVPDWMESHASEKQ